MTAVPTFESVLADALTLPPVDRDELRCFMAMSLDGCEPEIHPAWTTEIARRIADLDAGRVELLDDDEADAIAFGPLDDE